MLQSIFEYEKIYDDAILQANILLNKILVNFKTLDLVSIDLSDVNYDEIIYQLETAINALEIQRVRYKFDKMSRDEFDIVLKNVSEGRPANLITIGKEHKLRKLDNLQLLSVINGLSIDTLLSYNKISSDDFDDLKEVHGVIKIPITIDIKERTRYSDLPVFGSVSGQDAWGVDWQNDIVLNVLGDIRILNHQDTLTQGIANRFGDYGDIPGYENETIDLDWGRDYAPELVDSMTIAKVSEKLLREPRVRDVRNIIIKTQEVGKTVMVDIIPINEGEAILSIPVSAHENSSVSPESFDESPSEGYGTGYGEDYGN